jgi:hypothetical protein
VPPLIDRHQGQQGLQDGGRNSSACHTSTAGRETRLPPTRHRVPPPSPPLRLRDALQLLIRSSIRQIPSKSTAYSRRYASGRIDPLDDDGVWTKVLWTAVERQTATPRLVARRDANQENHRRCREGRLIRRAGCYTRNRLFSRSIEQLARDIAVSGKDREDKDTPPSQDPGKALGNPVGEGASHRGGAAGDVQPFVDAFQVGAHGSLGDAEAQGDLGVGVPAATRRSRSFRRGVSRGTGWRRRSASR